MTAPALTRALPTFTFGIRSSKKGSDGLRISGIANQVHTTDDWNTRFAFTDECIRQSLGHSVLFTHDPMQIVGKNEVMDNVREGLYVEDVIYDEALAPNGIRIVDLVERRALTAFSIRFQGGTRQKMRDYDLITPDYLPEHSVLALPSNPASTFSPEMRALLRSLDATPDGQEVARVFRLAVNGTRDLPAPEQPEASEARPTRDLPAPEEGAARATSDADPAPTPPDPAPQEDDRMRTPPTRDQRTPTPTRAAGPLSLDLLSRRLGVLIRDRNRQANWDDYAYIVSVYDEFLVYSVYESGRYYRQAYTVDDAGNVELSGDAVEVLPSWTVVGEAAATDDAADGTRGASGPAPTPVAAQPGPLELSDGSVTRLAQAIAGALRESSATFGVTVETTTPTEPVAETTEQPAPTDESGAEQPVGAGVRAASDLDVLSAVRAAFSS